MHSTISLADTSVKRKYSFQVMPNPKITGNIIGFRIQKARKKVGLTQLELSTTLDVDYKIELSPELISRIESGSRPLRDKEIAAICEILKVSPNTLFGWK